MFRIKYFVDSGKSFSSKRKNKNNVKSRVKMSTFASGISNSKSLQLKLSHALGHEVEEGELAGLVAVLVHEAAGQVAAEDGTEVVLGDLGLISGDSKIK